MTSAVEVEVEVELEVEVDAEVDAVGAVDSNKEKKVSVCKRRKRSIQTSDINNS